jgi:uncharacterized membrane protein
MKNRPQNVYRWTAIAWLVGMIVHLIWAVLHQRNQPPTDEIYTRMLSFQIASFTLTSFPYWLGALLVILVIEFAILGRKK